MQSRTSQSLIRLSLVISLTCIAFLPSSSYGSEVQTGEPDEGLPWIDNIVAAYFGSDTSVLRGAYGNKLYTGRDFFCALPSSTDSLDVLGGKMACRIDRCGDLNPSLDELQVSVQSGEPVITSNDRLFEYWPDSGDVGPGAADTGPTLGELYGWVIDGTEGDGLFRVIEIKPSGKDGPILEAFVADVGPWCIDDPYWQDYSRPFAECGTDSFGRRTNGGGIDLSYALAQAIGCTGIMEIDWRWKTIDGAYVVQRRLTEWNY